MTTPSIDGPDDAFEQVHEDEVAAERGREPLDTAELVRQIKETADKLMRDQANRGDVKLLNTALKELRYAFKIFAAYRHRRKVTVFGSARLQPDHPAYQAAVDFGREISAAGFMVVTGAAAGIMEAGHVGASREHSIGLNILLPFEQSANRIIAGDTKLMHLKYFFTRKLLLVKESDAVAVFPGGFGTQDEAFEALTLVQTGKSHMFPIVLVDEPGGDYWRPWQEYVEGVLLARRLISPEDRALYRLCRTVEEAVAEIKQFYRVFHSMRFVKGELVLRLHRPPGAETLARLQTEFADLVTGGTFQLTEALPAEGNETQLAKMPRLRFRYNRRSQGRLRTLIDTINREV